MGIYKAGMAFIVEGATEKVFYTEYLRDFAQSNEYTFSEIESMEYYDYEVGSPVGKVLIKIRDVGTVSQIANAGVWFKSVCVGQYNVIPWHVFLGYDTDGYNGDISKFRDGDWANLRKDLSDAACVIDLAAEADIEDIMLYDSKSILAFLGLSLDTPIPSGNKGKSKMKKLYLDPCNPYHEGDRARKMIRCLDFSLIAQKAPIPLLEINKLLDAELKPD